MTTRTSASGRARGFSGKPAIYSAVLFSLFMAAACQPGFLAGKTAVPVEAGPAPEVHFCPQDDCEDALVGLIKSANESVYCAFYDLELGGVIASLIDTKALSAIVVEKDNMHGGLDGLGHLVTDTNPSYMHNKFCVIDSYWIATGSMNPTENGAYKNNNNLLIIGSEHLAENYLREHLELAGRSEEKKNRWKKVFINSILVESYFCPEDCAGRDEHSGLGRIIRLIDQAEHSIDIAAFSLTHDEIGDALARARGRGVAVRAVLESRQNNQRYSEFSKLRSAGIDVRLDNNPNSMHHKFIIFDGLAVEAGSPNFSVNGFGRNDENILIIHDRQVAAAYGREFERIYSGQVVQESS